jgi:hypothetical protein
MPSSVRVGGSRMSMIATSGGEPWMRATRSSALSELATTSRPVTEDPGNPLPRQHAVLGDGYPHGIAALTCVPPLTGVRICIPSSAVADTSTTVAPFPGVVAR